MNGYKPVRMKEFWRQRAEAIEHIRCCCTLCLYQLRMGRRVFHEHPWNVISWNLERMQSLMSDPTVQLVQGHVCHFGMLTHIGEKQVEKGLVKKPTGFLTSSDCIAQVLNLERTGVHAHAPLVGGRVAGAQVYPEKLCQAMVNGIFIQKEVEESNRVRTGRMNKGQLSSLTRSLCTEIC